MQVLKENGKDYKRVYCTKKCSNNVRVHSEETKLKIGQKSKGRISSNKKVYTCRVCGKVTIKHRKTCSDECLKRILHSTAVKRSISKRSKNECLFAELCIQYFKNVETNKSIFNGWDADVIIHDIKIAILWNGIWHYKKITKLHSVEQIQNRDRLKIKEIENYGYQVYVIKDLGKYKKEFVEEKFKEFLHSLVLN